MQFEDSDEQIKNEGVITVRTMERIAGESTTIASLGHPAITRKKKATRIENILQALCEACKHVSKPK